jgi:hypothetical protein
MQLFPLFGLRTYSRWVFERQTFAMPVGTGIHTKAASLLNFLAMAAL